MSESSPSASKTLSWLLVIMLIGVVALYTWHNDNQKEILSHKAAEVAQAAQLLADKDAELGQSRDTEKALQGEIEALKTKHREAEQSLMGNLDAANQAYQRLEGEMDALRQEHADTLAAEQAKARQAYTELERRHDAATQQIAALGSEMERLEQAMTEAAAEHESRAQELERNLTGRINFYRNALEGSEPERAAQLAGLEQLVQTEQRALQDAQQALQTLKATEADLTQRLADAAEINQEKDQTLAEAARKQEALRDDLTEERSALAALQSKHEAAVDEAARELAAIRQQLQRAEEAHAKAQADTAEAMRQAEETHASRMSEAQGEISALTKNLKTETASLAALKQKHDSMVAELRGTIDSTNNTLSDLQAELEATTRAAEEAKEAHGKKMEEAQANIAGLGQALDEERKQAAEELAATQKENADALAYTHEIYRKFSELGGRYTEQGMLLSLADTELQFRVSKAELPDGELPSLDRIAALLVEYPSLVARIEGHTDSKGREETNLELSRKRADAVKQALVERNVAEQRMVAEGIGAARPIGDNNTSAGRRQNRRVEIYVSEK